MATPILQAPYKDRVSDDRGLVSLPWQKYFENLKSELNLISTEVIDDRVNDLLIAGTNITLVYNDVANTLTISAAGGGGSLASTDDLSEGVTNLYFTNERVDDRVNALIQNGTGLNWSYNDGANTLTGNVTLSAFDTDDLSEGSTNLYFTNERVDDRINALFVAGTNIALTYDDTLNTFTIDTTDMIERLIFSISTPQTLASATRTDYVYFVSGTTTVTMPTAVGNTNRYTIKNSGSNTVTVIFTGAETADGSASLSLTPNTSLDLVSDNSNYRIS
jgi:hypothetical protein